MNRILSLFIVFCLLFSMAGCGKDTVSSTVVKETEKEEAVYYCNEMIRALE